MILRVYFNQPQHFHATQRFMQQYAGCAWLADVLPPVMSMLPNQRFDIAFQLGNAHGVRPFVTKPVRQMLGNQHSVAWPSVPSSGIFTSVISSSGSIIATPSRRVS